MMYNAQYLDGCIKTTVVTFLMSAAGLRLISFALLIVATGSTLPGCRREVSLPRTSDEAAQLRWVEHADVLSDFREQVERNHDTRFLSQAGLTFKTEFPGLGDSPEMQQVVKEHGSRRI